MSAWYDNSVFYHMYPLGMTGRAEGKSRGGRQRTGSASWMNGFPISSDSDFRALYRSSF